MGRVAMDEPAACELNPEPVRWLSCPGRPPGGSESELSPALGKSSSVNSMSFRAADFSAPGLRAVGNRSGNLVAADHDFLSDETS